MFPLMLCSSLMLLASSPAPVQDSGTELQSFRDMKSGLWGFRSATKTITPAYSQVRPFQNGLAAVCRQGLWGLVNTRGETVLALSYQEISPWVRGCARLRQNDRYGLCGSDGAVLLPPSYTQIAFHGGALILIDEQGAFVADMQGRRLHQDPYQTLQPWTDELLLAVRKGTRGLCDVQGREVLPCIMDDIEAPVDGLMRLRHHGRYGYANLQGAIVIPPEYESISRFTGASTYALKDGRWLRLARNGSILPDVLQQIAQPALTAPPPPAAPPPPQQPQPAIPSNAAAAQRALGQLQHRQFYRKSWYDYYYGSPCNGIYWYGWPYSRAFIYHGPTSHTHCTEQPQPAPCPIIKLIKL